MGAAQDGPLHIRSIVNMGLKAGSDWETVGIGNDEWYFFGSFSASRIALRWDYFI